LSGALPALVAERPAAAPAGTVYRFEQAP
jgi:hypothetical protein